MTFCALGLAVTILVPNADAAPAVVNGIYFPVVFISGVFYPLAQGSVLARIADWFPVFHMIRALVKAFEGGPGSGLQGAGPGGDAGLGRRRHGVHRPPVPVGAEAQVAGSRTTRTPADPSRRPAPVP